jgi:hypothetical protein
MPAIVANMVEQRTAMDARKSKMDDVTIQHMQMGKESISECPMIKGDETNGRNIGGRRQRPSCGIKRFFTR